MATKSKKIAADTKANVTPSTKATAVETTSKKDVSTKQAVTDKTTDSKTSEKTKAEKKEVVKKTAPKKAADKKTTAPKKTSKKADAFTTSYVLQFNGKEIHANNILDEVKNAWVSKFQGKLEEIKSIDIYIKPEENRAYFVVNGLSNGDYFVEL